MLARGLASLVAVILAAPVAAAAQTTTVHRTELVSVSAGGIPGNGVSTGTAISGDGRYVAFASSADNLVGTDDNGVRDVFVRDTMTGATTLVSRATDGTIGNSVSSMPAISADGRYVAFESWASNLGGGAVNKADIFIHDRKTEVTSLVSKASDGNPGDDGSHHPSISADGTRIAFYSYADNFSAIDEDSVPNTFVHDTDTASTTLVSRATGGTAGDQESVNPAISADGSVVVFQSLADNLVAGSPDADGTVDVFAHQLDSGTTAFVSKASDGTPGSGDSSGDSFNPSVSADGRYVAFASRADTLAPDDALFLSDIFVHDRHSAQTTHVSRASDGAPGAGPPFGSFNPSISADGRYVAFDTTFTNLSDDDFDGVEGGGNEVADIFVHDRQTGAVRFVSRSTAGVAGDRASYLPRISADGRFVAFESDAETLSAADADDQRDIFMHKLIPAPPANIAVPALTGTGVVGATLTCDAGSWSSGTVTWTWRRDGVAISAANAPEYTLTAADAGAAIDCLVTATNADGSSTVVTPAVAVAGTAGADGDALGASLTPSGANGPRQTPLPNGVADTTAPRLSKVALTRTRFRAGGDKDRGTRLRFELSERATIRVAIERRLGKRWRSAATIRRREVKSGRHSLRISGRFGRRTLAPGRYRVAISATDAAGNPSQPVRRIATIIR